LKKQIFSLKSDVWSFGVVLWEILNVGSTPYGDMSNEEVIEFVDGGNTLIFPNNCNTQIKELATQCFAQQPQNRPDFKKINNQFTQKQSESRLTEVTTNGVDDQPNK